MSSKEIHLDRTHDGSYVFNRPRTRPEVQYLNAVEAVYHFGADIPNERTGMFCRTFIDYDFTYDASTNEVPLITTRKAPTILPIAELLGYIRGYTNAQDFAKLGTKSWFANANETQAWVDNPNRTGEDDMGLVYGAIARKWPTFSNENGVVRYTGNTINLIRQVYDNLKKGIDNRGLVITFWNPGYFNLGCLRPCLHSYQFSLIKDDLYLHATQRSHDILLGGPSNMVQVYLLLKLMAQITDKNPKLAFHKVVNTHIYENQLPLVQEQLKREPLQQPTIEINPDIKSLEDLETWVTVDDFQYTYNEYHPAINYPFAS